jgi:tRNA-splicing ligase RtcB
MKQVISEGCRIPIKMWLDDVEESALAQARNLANLPFAYKHVALMPDCHSGYGMPIGGVLATEGVVIPNAVGVDIGCGMCAIKTSLTEVSKETIKQVMSEIRQRVPLGFDHQTNAQEESLMPSLEPVPTNGVVARQYIAARKQIGTLGGGNHFIEIQKGSDSHIWVMIHSGSRNIGLKVADHYNRIAKAESNEAKDYFAEMKYCVDFALANRKLMMQNIMGAFEMVVGNTFSEVEFINIAHNYARWENHFGKNVIVHRKGATSAKEGEIGIIPGSQGTKSYIVKGKGNPESFESCSHGAGRKMGRKQAQKQLNLENEIAMLNQKGIVHGIRSIKDLDEAPGAYKSIDIVMANQKELVDIIVELTPLAVIKG